MCRTQEIAFEPIQDEWKTVNEWSEVHVSDEVLATPPDDPLPTRCRLCCKPTDSQVEEVLVVHHEALQKVSFLLRHDELQSCESPAIPECVTAMRRAKIQKRLQNFQRPAQGRQLPVLSEASKTEAPEEDDPSDEDVARQADDDFKTEQPAAYDFEVRMRAGLPMWLPPPDGHPKMAKEEVSLKLLGESPAAFSVDGQNFHAQIALAWISCIPLPHLAGKNGDDAAFARVLVSPPKGSEIKLGPGSMVHLLEFQNMQDASDFRDWLRLFHGSVAVNGEQSDLPSPTSCLNLAREELK